MNEFGWVSWLAVAIAGGAMLLAVMKSRNNPILRSRELELERKVSDLERDLDKTKALVETLLKTLQEKEARNHSLEREIATLMTRVRELELAAPRPAPKLDDTPTLLVVLGNDPALRIDLDALRELDRERKFRIRQPYPASKDGIRSMLDRYRGMGNPIRYVHFAVHSAPAGIEVGEGDLITPAWLSDNFKSVDVLVINGCRSDAIGDWLGIVPTVITMRNEVSNTDAAQFGRAFWDAIGDGMAVQAAYFRAIDRSPQGIGEFVEMT